MADTKQSPPRQTMKDFVRKSPSEAPGPAHPCDAPGLSPIEFLQAIYRDPRLPMSTRIDAARGLLPYTEPRPIPHGPTITIVIGGIKDPEQIVGETQSNSVGAEYNHRPLPTTPGPSYIEKTFPSLNTETLSDPPFMPDYSRPPTPEEIQQIKSAVHALRPDLAHLPIPEPHLCPCGHWIFGPCPCPSRDPSKMN